MKPSWLAIGVLFAGTAAAQTANMAPAAKPQAADQQGIRVLLSPSVETALVSPIAGRITQVNVSLGQAVSKGKVLVSFDCEEQRARARMADAELASAQASHEAKLRLQGLDQAGEVEVSLAASAVERARAQLSLTKAQLSQCTVSAPFSGRAAKVAVKPHQGVNQGQPLVDLVGDGPLKLRLNAPAKWTSWLKPGTPFDVLIDETNQTYKAKVTAINARIDAVSQSIELEATITVVAPELLPGMSGTAKFSPPS